MAAATRTWPDPLDEAIHVAYLQTAVSELRSFRFKSTDGGLTAGADIIDPVWQGLVQWHSVTTVEHAQAQTRAAIEQVLSKLPDGAALTAQFDSLQ